MRQFTEDDVRSRLSMGDAMKVLRQAFRAYAAGEASHQPRRRLYLKTGSVLHSMTGAYGQYFGTKVYATNPRHGAWFTVLLFDAETAAPLAQFEANWLGQIRTGAVSGLAVDSIVEPGRRVQVGCIGSGFQARSQLQAIAEARPVESVKVWSRKQKNREAFAREMTKVLGRTVTAAGSAEDACAGSGVVVTATYSKDPVLERSWIADGALVLAMGSNHPQRRELPGDLVGSVQVVVEDREAARVEAGDLLLALDEDGWTRTIELKELVSAGRAVAAGTTTVFKSVGIGLADVAVAGWLYEQFGL